MSENSRVWLTDDKIDELVRPFVIEYEKHKLEIIALERSLRDDDWTPPRFFKRDLVVEIVIMQQSGEHGRVLVDYHTVQSLLNLSASDVTKHLDLLKTAEARRQELNAKPAPVKTMSAGTAILYFTIGVLLALIAGRAFGF